MTDSSSNPTREQLRLEGFDLIVAADFFVYIGNLEKILLNFAKLSNGNDLRESYLIFSCERIDDNDDNNDKKICRRHRPVVVGRFRPPADTCIPSRM